MSDLRELTGRILSQAQAEAEQITAQSAAEAAKILAEAETKAAAAAAQITGEYQAKIEAVERRLQIEAELESRKQRLAAKHRLIEKVFDEALTAMKKMPEKQRGAFLARKLAAAGANNGGEVQAAGPSAEWRKIIQEANALLARSGNVPQLVLSNETPEFEGGFLLKGPGFTVDGSYRAILSECKDELVPEIARYLFESEKR